MTTATTTTDASAGDMTVLSGDVRRTLAGIPGGTTFAIQPPPSKTTTTTVDDDGDDAGGD